MAASSIPVVEQLKAFQKIQLTAGATKKLTFIIQPKNLQLIGLHHQWIGEVGTSLNSHCWSKKTV